MIIRYHCLHLAEKCCTRVGAGVKLEAAWQPCRGLEAAGASGPSPAPAGERPSSGARGMSAARTKYREPRHLNTPEQLQAFGRARSPVSSLSPPPAAGSRRALNGVHSFLGVLG